MSDFFRRRLIRLHPMVVFGAVVGLACFLLQGCERWDGCRVSVSMAMLALLAAMFMIPAWPGCPFEVRGNGEMFPLNGPAWSLFFEYIGNIQAYSMELDYDYELENLDESYKAFAYSVRCLKDL